MLTAALNVTLAAGNVTLYPVQLAVGVTLTVDARMVAPHVTKEPSRAAAARTGELTTANVMRVAEAVDRLGVIRGQGRRRPPFERGLRQDKSSDPPDPGQSLPHTRTIGCERHPRSS